MCVKEPWHNRACFSAWTLLAFIQGFGAFLFSLAGENPFVIRGKNFKIEFHAWPLVLQGLTLVQSLLRTKIRPMSLSGSSRTTRTRRPECAPLLILIFCCLPFGNSLLLLCNFVVQSLRDCTISPGGRTSSGPQVLRVGFRPHHDAILCVRSRWNQQAQCLLDATEQQTWIAGDVLELASLPSASQRRCNFSDCSPMLPIPLPLFNMQPP
jgi:hypothetical protein